MGKVTGGCRWHNEKLHDMSSSLNITRMIKKKSSSLNITRMIKSGKDEMRGAVARIGREEEVHAKFWWGNLRERNHLEEPGIDGLIILQ